MSEPVRFDHTAIADAAVDLCAVVRRTCPLEGGPSFSTGTRETFDSDVAAYGQLSLSSTRLARLLNPGAADPLIGILAWESPHHIHRGEPDERLRHALLKVWEGFASRPKLHFSSHSWNPSDRTMSPRSLPTIDPTWLDELEAAGRRLRGIAPNVLAASVFRDANVGESSDAGKAPWRDYLERARRQFLELARPDVRFVAVARGQRDDCPPPPASGKIEWATQDLTSLGGWTLGPDPADAKRQARFGLHATYPVERHAAGRPPNATTAFRHAVTLAVSGILAGGQGPLDTKGMSSGTADLATRAWIRALFDLCWAGNAPNLRAPRIYWAQMLHDGLVLDTICECPAWIAEQWPIGETPPLNPLEAAMGGPPPWYAHWYAILPDVALASVAACDYLLSYQPGNPSPGTADEDPIDPQTAGLVLSALEQGRKISPRCAAISVPPAKPGHVFEFTYPAGNDQAKFDALDRLYALLDLELGVERKAALRGLVGHVALAQNIRRAEAANLPLAEFVQIAAELRNVSPMRVAEPTADRVAASNGESGLAALVANPGVIELLALLWHAPDREAGLAVRELPEHLRRDAVLVPCEGFGLIQFARRNYVTKGPIGRGSIILEPGWNVAHLDRPDRKTPSALVQEALTEEGDDRVRLRVRLTRQGQAYAGAAALSGQSAPVGGSRPPPVEARPIVPVEAKGQTKRERLMAWVAKAMLLVQENPERSDASIAEEVGVDKSRLSRNRAYQAAANFARESRKQNGKPTGFVTRDADSGATDVEAIAQAGGQADRGEPIRGSNLFREYCSECDEPMRVPKNQVGTNPRCKDCLG